MIDTAALLPEVLSIAHRASDVLLHHYRKSSSEVNVKTDGSPVTAADREADALIVRELQHLKLIFPIVSEETYALGIRENRSGDHWLVDPLDGTKEFVKRNGHFTVNIALIHQGRPILGVIVAPALKLGYMGAEGQGAWASRENGTFHPVHVRPSPPEGLTAVVSRSHSDAHNLDAYLKSLKIAHRTDAGSSLKFGLIAAGEADVYPRMGRTMEWDTAAGDAILCAAGGRVEKISDSTPLDYGKEDLVNPPFVAWGGVNLKS